MEGGRVRPALDQSLSAQVESVLEVEQRDRHAQGDTGAPGVARESAVPHLLSKEIQIRERFTGVGTARQGLKNTSSLNGLRVRSPLAVNRELLINAPHRVILNV